jgi:hypothetical protein
MSRIHTKIDVLHKFSHQKFFQVQKLNLTSTILNDIYFLLTNTSSQTPTETSIPSDNDSSSNLE